VTSDLERALAYLRARFRFDARERIACGSDPAPPRFAMARTAVGCIWRFRADLDPERIRALAKYAAREPGIENPVAAPHPERLEPMRRVLGDASTEATVARLLLHCPLESAPASARDGAPPPCEGDGTPEALAFLAAQGHGAALWGDSAGLADIENRSLRIYGDLLLLG
jgi:hypothetical protein